MISFLDADAKHRFIPDYISAVAFSGESEVFLGKTILA